MTTTTKKNNIEEQKNDLREMASLLIQMSKEEKENFKYFMKGMNLMAELMTAEKAGQEGERYKMMIAVILYILMISSISGYLCIKYPEIKSKILILDVIVFLQTFKGCIKQKHKQKNIKNN